MEEKMMGFYKDCMKGRTMFVIPYSMGPVGSKLSAYGIEITDSPYVVQSMNIMTRIGNKAAEKIHAGEPFVPGESNTN